jgi:UDP:flavonoid glycosyltransferase YjiC (YdhE family)
LSHIYTEADRTLYADVRELVPTFDLPTSHRYIGPIIWSPSIDPPDWWDSLPQDRPLIYVTLGSSGQTQLLGRVLAALADLRVYVLAATAAKDRPAQIPVNAFVADYLPGSSAAERSVLVICNGGSPTTQQALSTGTPVLGIPSNMDQYLNMESVCRAGAGRVLRSGQAAVPSIRQAVEQMLHDKDYAKSAARVCDIFRTYDAAAAFQQVLVEILGSPGTQASRQCTSSYASHGNE